MLSREDLNSLDELLSSARTDEDLDYVESEIEAALREAFPPPPAEWTIRPRLQDIGELFGVDLRTVEKWRASGMPGERGAWALLPIIDWVYTRGHREAGETENQERLRRARAELEEIKLGERRGELVPISDLHDWLNRLLTRLRELQEAFKRGGHDIAHNMTADALEAFASELDQISEES